MTLDYNTIRYLELLGNGSARIHYTDGKKVFAYPDGRNHLVPAHGNEGAPPETYDPWTPPADPPPPPSTGAWMANWADGFTLTSGFGMRTGGFHYGIDISSTTAPVGLPIYSVADMVITVAIDAYEGGNSTAGTYVKGHTTDGAYTFTYNHGADNTLAVAAGQTVTAGTKLFMEGATGNVTGTHCHFETIEGTWDNPWAPPYNNGANFVDPLPVLRAHGVNI
jgi:murein DD-endopeptidase MepM/ murein hydrolase activator NlpD